ncbi:hypothetical protein ACIOJE_41015 [Kitasatospora sp. NPDC087861]
MTTVTAIAAAPDENPGPMTVGELRAILRKLPADRRVVLSGDAEGNCFSPAWGIGDAMYDDLYGWCGEAYPLPEELDNDPELKLLTGKIPDSAVRVFVLYPMG